MTTYKDAPKIPVLHITPSTNGYEEVLLLANRVNQKNYLSVIELPSGDIHMTGGLIFSDTPEIRQIFDAIPKEKLYKIACDLRVTPYAKVYYEADPFIEKFDNMLTNSLLKDQPKKSKRKKGFLFW